MRTVHKLMVGVVVIYFALTIAFLSGCSIFKAAGRTINDAAMILCEIVVTDQIDQLSGMSPKEWCAIHRNLEPFIDEVLTARKRTEDKLGFERPE